MKKVFLTAVLVFAGLQLSNAQISFGLKGGINKDLNSEASKFVTLPTGYSLETEESSGYHGGVWLRVKVPIVGLYVRPEIIYTNMSSKYNIGLPANIGGITLPAINASAEYSLNKIDVPVLLGFKVFGVGNIFLGPNVQYLMKSELTTTASTTGFTYNETNDAIDNEISFGLVAGIGLEFWKLGLDARFETGFNIPDENLSNFTNAQDALGAISNALGNQKPNQIIIGLSYKF